jgi:hypothetical protein
VVHEFVSERAFSAVLVQQRRSKHPDRLAAIGSRLVVGSRLTAAENAALSHSGFT